MPLNVSERTRGTRRLLTVTGELDMDTAGALVNAALAQFDAGEPDVVIDARELSFCDSSGLSAFVRIANQLSPSGGRLAIADPHPMVSRVLEVSGLVDAFIVADTVDEAIAALAAPAAG